MQGDYSWVDLTSLLFSIASFGFTVAIFLLGRRLSFRQQRERVRELTDKAWEVLKPMRLEGLNSDIIVMNAARYAKGYNGSNPITFRGNMYSRAEFIEVVHDGVEVILGGTESYYADHGRRTLTRTEHKAPNVVVCGHIPWKWIEDIQPEGDEYNGAAIFFVRHRAPGWRPYDYITYREGKPVPFGPNDRDYYHPIQDLGIIRPRLSQWWGFLLDLRRLRKIEQLSRVNQRL